MTALSFPWDEVPSAPDLKEVSEGVRWLRMPLPFALDHINLWVLEDGDGKDVLVDTGVSNEKTRDLWEQIFAGALAGRSVSRVISTHFHPDHMGLAGWLCDRWSVPLLATMGEWAFGMMLSHDLTPDFTANQVSFYRRLGFDEDKLELVRGRKNPYAPRVWPIPKAITRIMDGDAISVGGRDWTVVVGRGHAPEHAALYCADANVLISGDQVLPRISPNVSVWPQEPDANPLAQFLESLEQIKARVPADVLVLPSHGKPFYGLHARIDQLIAHHHERLDVCRQACVGEARTVPEMVPVLFERQLDDHQIFFAIGETLAHLHWLVGAGEAERTRDDNGTYRFKAR